jgi:hypothetical protein
MQQKNNQNNDTYGRLVPIIELDRLGILKDVSSYL